jgi:PqqD family protein of HPr-rel-A system
MLDSVSAKIKWQCIKPLSAYKPESDEESLIFNPQSGETHLINFLACDILEFLQQPKTIGSLAAYLYDLYQVENTSDLDAQLMPLIEQLHDLGLIYASSE